MKKIITTFLLVLVASTVLSACTNKQLGTTGGAVVGGVAGNVISGGSGVGTAVGAVGGGLAGNALSH